MKIVSAQELVALKGSNDDQMRYRAVLRDSTSESTVFDGKPAATQENMDNIVAFDVSVQQEDRKDTVDHHHLL